jgi:hypothetical protein
MTMTDKNVLNNYPETCAEYDLIVSQIRELFLKKQGDYGPNNISMGGDLELAKIAIVPLSQQMILYLAVQLLLLERP